MMIIRTTAGQVFGPFASVETLEDRYRADGIDYQFDVLGEASVEEQGDWHPSAPPMAVPDAISPRQVRQALTRAGLRLAVENAIAASPQDLRDWWEFAPEFERHHPMVLGMAQQLSVSADQLDQLWTVGATL